MFEDGPPMPWPEEPTGAAPQRSPHPKRRNDGLALLLIGALVGGAVGLGGGRAPTTQILPNAVAGAPASTSTTTATSTDAAAQAAIRDVLQKANAAQAVAFAKNDPTAMKATSTTAHYAEMVKVNADLAAGGVTSIALVKITFGDITVSGSTGTATATETWSSSYADGSADQSTDLNDYALVLENGSWKVSTNTQPNATLRGGSGGTAPTTPTNPQAPTSGVLRSASRNWSGYVATGGTYGSVTGTWVVPRPDPKVPGVDATWVGIGGANTTDLIQAGTEATVNVDGTVTYDAWTETLPQSTHTISLTVNPGDTVTVTLTEQSAALWLVELKNVTTTKTYATAIRYSSSTSSAEWIEEAPSVGRGIAPLDSFGIVKFTAASTAIDGKMVTLSGAGAKAVTMIDGANQPLAIPTAIGTDGSSFSVTRTSTPATNTGSAGRSPGRRRG